MKTVWHSGPPPSMGWWPTETVGLAVVRKNDEYRWWDGYVWSVFAQKESSKKEASDRAMYASIYYIDSIKWKNRPKNWPERSKT